MESRGKNAQGTLPGCGVASKWLKTGRPHEATCCFGTDCLECGEAGSEEFFELDEGFAEALDAFGQFV